MLDRDQKAQTTPALDNVDRRAIAAGLFLELPGKKADPVCDDTKRTLAEALGPAPAAPAETTCPAFVPKWLDETRIHGIALQLYQLRSARNFGIGDLGDLQALIGPFAGWGVDFIGLNPLHALFTAAPERASPFSPSDRRFLNPLIVAVDKVPGFRPHMTEAVTIPGAEAIVDYTAVARAKLTVLRAIHAAWQNGDPRISETEQREALRHATDGGAALHAFALFEALSHHMVQRGYGAGWTSWPAAYQDFASPDVRAFAATHAGEIAFHVWLQHVAEGQLAETQALALAAGMRVGLYLDIAIGTAPDGAATWADPELAMGAVSVGAPPDMYSADGQCWNLAPLSPRALSTRNYVPFKDILSAAMKHAGAVRLDHAMGLERLFLIPAGKSAAQGAYVRQTGLTEALVEASQAHETLVVGEDIGVVQAGFRERMALRRIFSSRIVAFERDGLRLRAPERYPRDALASFSTHDLAPLAAAWRSDEVDLRQRLGRVDARTARHEKWLRLAFKHALLAMTGLSPFRAMGPLNETIVVEIHRMVARTASRLTAVRLEDVVGGRRLVNLPGTDREHPNWRHTLPLTVDEVVRSPVLNAVMRAVGEERPAR